MQFDALRLSFMSLTTAEIDVYKAIVYHVKVSPSHRCVCGSGSELFTSTAANGRSRENVLTDWPK
jgi:hypothetical protein